MENKVYGKITINSDEQEWRKNYPMELEYYETQRKNKEEKEYGIGVTKRCINNKEIYVEQKEFNNILDSERETRNLLEILLSNRVTPIGLKDVICEFIPKITEPLNYKSM